MCRARRRWTSTLRCTAARYWDGFKHVDDLSFWRAHQWEGDGAHSWRVLSNSTAPAMWVGQPSKRTGKPLLTRSQLMMEPIRIGRVRCGQSSYACVMRATFLGDQSNAPSRNTRYTVMAHSSGATRFIDLLITTTCMCTTSETVQSKVSPT